MPQVAETEGSLHVNSVQMCASCVDQDAEVKRLEKAPDTEYV